ncbi:hypothetical protein [Microlunatus parietis]|uniref:Clp amino terminal domain-containing protein, pathogenicity island component n=1 Tax=Microlunatus parietis TaxID=682979 RepID=A0A7Y9LDT9_9ACTN|nr:hypothetical protein [Microlunatus parietis]NYE74267.1 hypothetical protein [Microlunatus parietis]
MRSKTTVAAAIAGSALAVTGIVAGTGVAAAEPTPTPSAGPSASGTPSADPRKAPDDRTGPVRHTGPGGVFAAPELAEKLGLDEALVDEALRAAFQELRPDRDADPDDRPSREERQQQLTKLLAEKLGVEQAAVEKALTELREAARADGIAALKERLAEAVEAGTLTQAEADAVVKAAEAGVIPAGPGRR